MSAVTGREASEFKEALDAIFDAQRGRLPVEADDNVAKAREEEKAAKARAAAEAPRGRLPAEADDNAAKAREEEEEAAKARAAAEAVLRLVRVSAEEELHRKRKTRRNLLSATHHRAKPILKPKTSITERNCVQRPHPIVTRISDKSGLFTI